MPRVKRLALISGLTAAAPAGAWVGPSLGGVVVSPGGRGAGHVSLAPPDSDAAPLLLRRLRRPVAGLCVLRAEGSGGSSGGGEEEVPAPAPASEEKSLDEITSIEQYKEGLLPLSEEDLLKFEDTAVGMDLALRKRQIDAAGGGEAGALVQLMTQASVGELLQSFFSNASPMVSGAMREAVSSLLGGLPRDVEVNYATTSEKLSNLASMLMMTGYLFRNAEYVVTLQQLLNIKSRSLEEYKRVFDAIDEDGSGFIEVSEVETLLCSFYEGQPAPAYEVEAFVRFFDRSRRGKISWADFKKGFGLATSGASSSGKAAAAGGGGGGPRQLPPIPDPRLYARTPQEKQQAKLLGPGAAAAAAASAGSSASSGDAAAAAAAAAYYEAGGVPLPNVSIEGKVTVDLGYGGGAGGTGGSGGGQGLEMDAVQYLDALQAEADALRAALAAAAEEELQEQARAPGGGGITAGGGGGGRGGPPPVSSLAEYIAGLAPQQKALLTEGIEPATMEAMRRLVSFMVGEANPEGAPEFGLDRSSLASLCLWQLVVGYSLRDAEATGGAKQLRGL